MSNFYTNVQLVKDKIYYIGYEDGRRVKERFDYSPTLYLTSQDDSEWKTLEGESVKGIKQGCVSDAKAFIDKYKEVENLSVYGYDRFSDSEMFKNSIRKNSLWSTPLSYMGFSGYINPFTEWGIHTLLLQALFTSLLAPMIWSWLLFLFRRFQKLT